jgi:microcystin-dependent protein
VTNTMILAPQPVQQYTDNNGVLLVGGQLFVYAAGTTTKQAAFTDASGATALPDPIVLNVRGEVAPSATGTSCGLWLDPTLAYKLVLAPANDTDPPTNPFWTIDNLVSPQSAILAALTEYQATLGGNPIGTMIAYGGATAPTGWLLCYGQAVSRTTYALLFAVLGTAYGTGDGSTTFNVPDKRGRMSIGADNMGGSAANRVTQAVSGILATTVGQAGGNQLAQTDTLTASTTVSIGDAGHQHSLPNVWNQVSGSGSAVNNFGAGTIQLATTTGTATTGITATAVTTVTSTLTGSSQNMPPTEVDNWIIFTGTSS